MPQVFVLYGPTASGKTGLAVQLAKHFDFEVINCDTMQMYHDLQVITARPTQQEMEGIPHHLYGTWAAKDRGTGPRWIEDTLPVLADVLSRGKAPLLVGGTGMYLKLLMEGFSTIPEIPDEIKEEGRARLTEIGNAQFYAELCALDSQVKDKLDPGNSQRLCRTWEVITATGQSIYDWQAQNPPQKPAPYNYTVLALGQDRQWIYDRVDTRFEQMMSQGAMEEVAALAEKNLDPSLPIMRAHGVPELIALQRGQMTHEEAITQAQRNTRHYVKRQLTWLRQQLTQAVVGTSIETDKNLETFISCIKGLQGGSSSSTSDTSN